MHETPGLRASKAASVRPHSAAKDVQVSPLLAAVLKSHVTCAAIRCGVRRPRTSTGRDAKRMVVAVRVGQRLQLRGQ